MAEVDCMGNCRTCGRHISSTGCFCPICDAKIFGVSSSFKLEPYTCPVCTGTGKVSRPPWVAGDQMLWGSNSTGPYECHSCQGSGIVWG